MLAEMRCSPAGRNPQRVAHERAARVANGAADLRVLDVAHYQQREFWRSVDHPEIGRAIPYPRGPFMSEALGIAPRARAPHLGEHTRLVLEGDLGLPAPQVDALAAAGVIR